MQIQQEEPQGLDAFNTMVRITKVSKMFLFFCPLLGVTWNAISLKRIVYGYRGECLLIYNLHIATLGSFNNLVRFNHVWKNSVQFKLAVHNRMLIRHVDVMTHPLVCFFLWSKSICDKTTFIGVENSKQWYRGPIERGECIYLSSKNSFEKVEILFPQSPLIR